MSESQMLAPLEKQQELAEMRNKIMTLERALLSLPAESRIHLEPTHYFAPGLYLRELFIPKDVTLTGAIHKTEHLCILAKGKVSVGGMAGDSETFQAPCVVRSMPGAKRAIYAHEDSLWINVHHNPTNETDLDQIWEIFTAKSFDELEGPKEPAQIEGS